MQINQPIIFLKINDRAQKTTICVHIKQSQDQLQSSSRFRLRSLSLFLSDTVNKILFLTGVITWLPLADLLIRNLIADC